MRDRLSTRILHCKDDAVVLLFGCFVCILHMTHQQQTLTTHNTPADRGHGGISRRAEQCRAHPVARRAHLQKRGEASGICTALHCGAGAGAGVHVGVCVCVYICMYCLYVSLCLLFR